VEENTTIRFLRNGVEESYDASVSDYSGLSYVEASDARA